jgi:hypothetical protein
MSVLLLSAGVLKLPGQLGSAESLEAAITIIAEYQDAEQQDAAATTANQLLQQQQYSTSSAAATETSSHTSVEEEEVLAVYTPLPDFETLPDYDDDDEYYTTLAEAQAAAAAAADGTAAAAANSAVDQQAAAAYRSEDEQANQYQLLPGYDAESWADVEVATDNSSSSSSHAAAAAAEDEPAQIYQPLDNLDRPLLSDPDYEEQLYLQQETAQSLQQPIPADELMLSQTADEVQQAQEAALQRETLDESALQYGALQAALQQEQPAWLQAYNQAVRERAAEQPAVFEEPSGEQQQQENAYEYETDLEADADAFWDESEDEVKQEAFGMPDEQHVLLQPQQLYTSSSSSSSSGSGSSGSSQIRDGWQHHHIFKGQPGTLDKCPAAWPIPDLWVKPGSSSSSSSSDLGQMLPFTAEVSLLHHTPSHNCCVRKADASPVGHCHVFATATIMHA